MTLVVQAENKPGHRKFEDFALPGWVRHPMKLEPVKAAILFPDEQNHYVGMLKDAKRRPAVKAMLGQAHAVFGFDVGALMRDGPVAKMAQTGFNQAITYVANCAAFELMKEKHPVVAERPQAVAGMGVGEISALYAAGVITYQQGLEIVNVRAKALQALAEEQEMENFLIRDYPPDKLDRLIKAAEKMDKADGNTPQVFIARRSSNDTVVLAGARSTILKIQDALVREMQKPGEARLLPDHLHAGYTPMASAAADKVAGIIDRIAGSMKPPRCEIFLNSTGYRVPPNTDPLAFKDFLKDQLVNCLVWDTCIYQMLRWGVSEFYEVGPNRSLRFLMSEFYYMEEAPHKIVKPATVIQNVSV